VYGFLENRNQNKLGLDAVDEDEGKFLIQTTTQVKVASQNDFVPIPEAEACYWISAKCYRSR